MQRLIGTLKRVIGYKRGERNEFRYNYDTEHPGYVFKKEKGKYKSFGLTHEDKTFGRKNMPLSQNPSKTDKRPAYIRNGVISQKGRMSKKPLKKLKFSDADKPIVKSKKRNYKKVCKTEAYKKRQSIKEKR